MSVTAGERRVVSVLVADVVGSTTIAERLGPERSKFLFDDVVRLMREEVERFGGNVAQLTGDGVLALFGAPVAHENDSERAVRAALAIRGALADYSAEVAPAYGLELGARVAVNTGPVVVPVIDAPPDVLYNALGDTVNVAARLQSFGDLVLGPATAHQVAEWFELEELGEVELKGKSELVAAYRVAGIRSERAAPAEPPFVGRREELETLTEALDGLRDESGAVVSITGEPGIGKSRLVAEIEKRFGEQVRFLAGHAASDTETIPYWPVRGLLRRWLGLGVSDPEAHVRLELRAQLASSLPESAEDAYPLLGALLGLALEPEQEQRIRDLASDALQHETFYWLYQLVCALAAERPLCLVLEDMHWADEATLSLLDELLPAVEQSPVCFLLVHRSDPDHPAWQLVDRARRRLRHVFREVEVAPLPELDARSLAATDAGGELPEELAGQLAPQSGGNPYFVAETIRDLREQGALVRENGRLVLAGEASVPGAVQEALQARLGRLHAEARELITTASVIGRSFGLPLLERVLPEVRLLPTLSELQWLQLVVQERGGAAPEYRFQHGLVQEVAYGSLLETRRREIHLAVGEALESIHHDSLEEVFGLLARHFSEADDPERAIEYLLRAGDAARAFHAEDEAIELYRRALDFLARTGDETLARRTLFKIALTHYLAFDFGAANEAFFAAFDRPAPPPTRLEPTEKVTWGLTAAWDRAAAPGHSWSKPAWEIGPNLFRGLVAIDSDLDIEPDLAERFTVSDDGRVYRFTLRRDAIWSDGTPVAATDFVFSYAQMVEDGVQTASYWLDRVTARAIDEQTLQIELREPSNDFLYVLAMPPFHAWPSHVYEREGSDWHRTIPLVGDGPFVLTAQDENHVVLEAAPGWYGPRGNVREVAIELEASPAAAVERWQLGKYDVLDDNFRPVPDDDTVMQRSPGLFTWYLGFDARQPPLDDFRVRRALAHAVDRHRVAGALGGSASAETGGLLPPTVMGHSQRVSPAFDPERARTLLREAGCDDEAALGEIVLAGLDLYEGAVSAIASELDGVGVETRLLVATSDPELLERSRTAVFMPSSGAGAAMPPLGARASSTRCSAGAAGSTGTSGSRSCSLMQPRRPIGTSACAPTASSSGSGSASRRPSCRLPTRTACCGGDPGSPACGRTVSPCRRSRTQ